MTLRKYRRGEEVLLHEVFYSAIHQNAVGYYTEAQLDAWAPANINVELWQRRIEKIDPFVIEDESGILGYADLQDNGYIDHFFVRGKMNRRGFGQALMNRILEEAQRRGMSELTSDVSLAAQSFFSKNGFEIVKRKSVVISGIELDNALMRKCL